MEVGTWELGQNIVARVRGNVVELVRPLLYFHDARGIARGEAAVLSRSALITSSTKDEYRRDQAENPPYGSNLCIDPRKIYTIHGTSGTIGKPGIFALSRGDVDRIANAHARVLRGFGLRPSDTVMITAFFSL